MFNNIHLEYSKSSIFSFTSKFVCALPAEITTLYIQP